MIGCVTSESHDFWQSCTGSQMIIETIGNPKVVTVKVYSISKPTVYEITTTYHGGHVDIRCVTIAAIHLITSDSYLTLKGAVDIVRSVYTDDTAVRFVLHNLVDLSSLLVTTGESPRKWFGKRVSSGDREISPGRGGDLRRSVLFRSPRSPKDSPQSPKSSSDSGSSETTPRSP